MSSTGVARYEHPTHVRARVAQTRAGALRGSPLLRSDSLPAAPMVVVGGVLCWGGKVGGWPATFRLCACLDWGFGGALRVCVCVVIIEYNII